MDLGQRRTQYLQTVLKTVQHLPNTVNIDDINACEFKNKVYVVSYKQSEKLLMRFVSVERMIVVSDNKVTLQRMISLNGCK